MPTTNNSSIIEVDNLHFSYEGRPVLENISLSIPKGQFVGIIGPNGSGKTTFMKLLAGLLKPTSGKLLVAGKAPHVHSQKVGYVPQANSRDLLFPITVFELVLSGLPAKNRWFGKYTNEEKEKAMELLGKFKLEKHKDSKAGELSGGLMQRCFLARVLIADPEILLLDEPTANIDPFTREQIFQFLFSMKGLKTICLVTHDLKTIIENVTQIICIEKKATIYQPGELCEHFTMGLYHTPLMES